MNRALVYSRRGGSSVAVALYATAGRAGEHKGGPAGWWTAVQEDLRRREYHIAWQESPLFPDGPGPSAGLTATSSATSPATSTRGGRAGPSARLRAGGYQAPNRAHNLRIGFYPTGIRVVERTVMHPTWSWGLALTSLGQGELLRQLPEATPVPQANRVEYQRDPVTEWYINDERGLEQTIQISNPQPPTSNLQPPTPNPQPPTSNLQPPIVLELALTGDLLPNLSDDGQAIEFTTPDGTPVLRYGSPRATDATGRPLPAHLELVPAYPRPEPLDQARGKLRRRNASRNPVLSKVEGTHHALRITTDGFIATYPITLRLSVTALRPCSGQALPSTADWTGESNQGNAGLGYALSTAGDVNNDGYSDLIVGAPWYDGGQADEGAAFVYYGSSTGLGSTRAWSVESNQSGAHFGAAVSIAGDVNGDDYADVIVGAPDYDGGQTGEGAAFVYHGSATGLDSTHAWSAESNQSEAHFGVAVSTAGDVNEDGYSDVIVGAPDYDDGQASEGAAFVYHGSVAGLTTDPADWSVTGDQAGAHFGAAVSTAGDVNGDGRADVIVGAPGYDTIGTTTLTDTGQAYVYHGSATGLTTGSSTRLTTGGSTRLTTGSSTRLTTGGSTRLTTGPADWSATGDQEDGCFGAAVSTAGDVNGDGYADVIIGAPNYDGGQTGEGAAFVYHGSATGLTGPADWNATGNQANAHFGAAVSIAGDVNGDGYADAIVGAPDYADDQAGEGAAFVYHGSATGLPGSADWSATGEQAGAHFGAAVSTAGDVNGDGHSDLAIGATGYDHDETDEGAAFVYHGGPAGLATGQAWSAMSKQAGALLGWSVSTAGDVDGDGYADVIVGAPRYDHGQTEEGVVFLYAGGPDGPATSPTWTGESDQEWAWFGQAVATAGDVNNDGYSDVIAGAPRYEGEQKYEGAAFIYHGGPSGLVTTSTLAIHPTDQADARFGAAVASAGDVNGDGYADVIITANGYDAEQINEGAAFVYHGGPTGLAADPAWTGHPTDQAYANFGRSASTAGDVNGDGYSDVVIGAPWYDTHQSHNSQNEGVAFVYYGSSTGLTATSTRGGTTGSADWTVTGDCNGAELGVSVSTAGDVNNDGYSDLIVGAYKYTGSLWREGAAFVYHGGPTGLAASHAWSAVGGQEAAKFGLTVSTAGDVNGDGYADVVVGAPNYANGQAQEGAALVYHGGPEGLDDGPAWSVEGNQEGAGFGFSVSTAGDVDGDGYSDLIVGAPTYNKWQSDEGAAFVYMGNGGEGFPQRSLAVRPRQMRSDGLAPIAPLGRSDSADRVRLQLTARMPLGRQLVAYQWQLAPLGTPFTAATAISGASPAWSDVLTTGVVLSQTVGGLTGGTVYRWRVRLLYRPGNRLGQASGRWLYLPWNGPQEADFRTPGLPAPDAPNGILLPLLIVRRQKWYRDTRFRQ